MAEKGKKIGGLTRGPTPPASRHCTRRKTLVEESRRLAEIVWPDVNPLLDLVHGFETNTATADVRNAAILHQWSPPKRSAAVYQEFSTRQEAPEVLPQCACGGNFSELQCRRQNEVEPRTHNYKLVFLFYRQH